MKVIMVAGAAGAGKDTFYELAKKHYSCVRLAFADELKEIAYLDFKWDGEKDVKGRQLLIDIGTIGRKYDKDMWVNIVLDRILLEDEFQDALNWVNEEIDFIIVTDFRYQNEYDVMRRCLTNDQLITVKIRRPFMVSMLTPEQKQDESETGLVNFKFDYNIPNVTLDAFENDIVELLAKIGGVKVGKGKNSQAS